MKKLTAFAPEDLRQKTDNGYPIRIEICGEYSLYYICYPNTPEKNHYLFRGKDPELDFGEIQSRQKTLDEIITFINTTYPKMKPEDWPTLASLQEAAKDAIHTAQWHRNETTLKAENEAMSRLVRFEKEHGLTRIRKD